MSSLCTNGVLSPQYPGRAGVPSKVGGFTSTFRTRPNILCGLRKQASQSTKSPIRHLIHFRVSRITLCTFNTTLFTTPDNFNTHIYNFRYSLDESHNSNLSLYQNTSALLKHPRQTTSCLMSPLVPPPVLAGTCNDTRLLDNRTPPTVDPNYKSHTPDAVNHTDIYYTRPIATPVLSRNITGIGQRTRSKFMHILTRDLREYAFSEYLLYLIYVIINCCDLSYSHHVQS